MKDEYKRSQAYQAYDEIIDLLKGMVRKANEELDEDSKIKVIDIIVPFDILLQYSLLETAFADDNLHYLELDFIRDVPKYGDIIKFYQEKLELNNLTWEYLYDLKPELMYKLLDMGKDKVLDFVSSFLSFFVVMDKAFPFDCYEMFEKNVIDLLCFIMAEDHDINPELETSKGILIASVLEILKKEIEG